MTRKYELGEKKEKGLRRVVYTEDFLRSLGGHFHLRWLNLFTDSSETPSEELARHVYGFIQDEDNHPNDFDDKAILVDGASVFEKAVVSEGAFVQGSKSKIGHGSVVGKGARLYGTEVSGESRVMGNALLRDAFLRDTVIDCPSGVWFLKKDGGYIRCKVHDAHGQDCGSHAYDSDFSGVLRLNKAEVDLSDVRDCVLCEAGLRAAKVSDADLKWTTVKNSTVEGPHEVLRQTWKGRRILAIQLRFEGREMCFLQGAVVKSQADVFHMNNFWSSGRTITYTRSNDLWNTGCFKGTTEEFLKSAEKSDTKDGGHRLEHVRAIIAYVESAGKLPVGPYEKTLLCEDGSVISDMRRIQELSNQPELSCRPMDEGPAYMDLLLSSGTRL